VAVTLRPVTAADADLLLRLMASTHADALVLAGLAPAGIEALLRMQVTAQERQYRSLHPDSEHSIVVVDGEAVGRLWVAGDATALRVLDITLLPGHRGHGLGGTLLRRIQEQAVASGRWVRLHVAAGNPAASLYARLGFVPCGGDQVHVEMVWTGPVTATPLARRLEV
jgi:ribosomal protein S18 acetylase RimI-like enzyme